VQPEERARVAVQPADAGGLRPLPVPPRQGPYAERERRDRRARPRPARTHRAREENLCRCAQGGRAAAAAERAALLEARAHGCGGVAYHPGGAVVATGILLLRF
jgi:hypothetical protein